MNMNIATRGNTVDAPAIAEIESSDNFVFANVWAHLLDLIHLHW